ncbi:cardiolipin synthase ClsB [Bordetella bronchiseptica]|uniref:cardiolipin synthase ClsB n=1 Tax=Bordetella bronchiseptica TaxID=518 RepID=UPI000460BC12|nr:cardiolipin synthase ClsB [Bordetella bronchiseptica]KDB91578.1 putative cardiolipin synthetase YbhO [Bordetella bronchiseptica D989]
MSTPWRDGNRFAILENGASYFPRVYTAIGKAREEILIETFILFDDAVGRELREALMAAARRGVRIDVTVDGYGSDSLPPDFIAGLVELGVGFHVFDPRPRLLGMRTNLFRRLHRKIVAIDGTLAYVGGLNFSADHLDDYGPQSKQDYAIEIAGPLAADIRDFARAALAAVPRRRWRRARPAAPPQAAGPARARLVVRDNDQHTNDIEQSYRVAIRAARRDIVIANAYFFPGYRLLRDLRAAAARGVRVRLILQGEPDMPIAQLGARLLYDALAEHGHDARAGAAHAGHRRRPADPVHARILARGRPAGRRCRRAAAHRPPAGRGAVERPAWKSSNTASVRCTARSPASTTSGPRSGRATSIRSAWR